MNWFILYLAAGGVVSFLFHLLSFASRSYSEKHPAYASGEKAIPSRLFDFSMVILGFLSWIFILPIISLLCDIHCTSKLIGKADHFDQLFDRNLNLEKVLLSEMETNPIRDSEYFQDLFQIISEQKKQTPFSSSVSGKINPYTLKEVCTPYDYDAYLLDYAKEQLSRQKGM